jgi:hypothetical protein
MNPVGSALAPTPRPPDTAGIHPHTPGTTPGPTQEELS